MAYVREKRVEVNLRVKAKTAGGRAYKFVSPGRPGVPDRLITLPIPPEHREIVAKYVKFVECKSPDGSVEPHQAREHKRLRDLGFVVVVLSDKNLENIL